MFVSVLLLWICLCFFFILFRSRRPKNFPPGPLALPFLGNALNLSVEDPLKYFESLRKTYGNVYSLYLGPRAAVVVSGTQALKEALVNKAVDFAGRPQGMYINALVEEKGVALADYGQKWKEHRRFALMTMKNFGLGKQSMEQRILGELQYTINKLEKNTGPRVCLGEGLARMELFLILVTLLRKFRFLWPENAGKPDYELVFGLTMTPQPYNMKVELRAAQ